MSNKKYLIVLVSILCVLLLSITGVVAAWLTDGTDEDLIITIGNLDSEVEVYQGQDFNFDGLLDQFEGTPEEIFAQQYHLLTRENLVNNVRYLFPGREVTFKVRVTNNGNINANISLKLNLGSDENTLLLSKVFACTDISYQGSLIPDVYLYQFNGHIVQNAMIEPGQTLEIDFKLTCLEYVNVSSFENGVSNTEYLDVMKELQNNAELILNIKSFEITSTQEDYLIE